MSQSDGIQVRLNVGVPRIIRSRMFEDLDEEFRWELIEREIREWIIVDCQSVGE